MLTDERKGDFKFSETALMDSNSLGLLAVAAQSIACAQSLIDSTLLRVLSQALTEFCLNELDQSDFRPRSGKSLLSLGLLPRLSDTWGQQLLSADAWGQQLPSDTFGEFWQNTLSEMFYV